MCQFQTHIVVKKKRRRQRRSSKSSSSSSSKLESSRRGASRGIIYSFKNLLQVFLGEEDVMTHEITMRREKNNAQNKNNDNKNNTTRTRTYHRVFHRSKRPGFDKLCSIPLHFILIVLCNKLQEREREREREREKREKSEEVFQTKKKKSRVKKNSQKGMQKEKRKKSIERKGESVFNNKQQQTTPDGVFSSSFILF